jgi:hypothetical protein
MIMLIFFYYLLEMTEKKISLKQCIEELSSKNTDYKFAEQAINQAESLKSLILFYQFLIRNI